VLSSSNRRDFVKTLIGGAACLPLARAAATPIAAVKLTDSIVQITGAGSNVLMVTGPDGVMLVDGGSAERSADLLKFVANPVQILFNTHWHWDHTGSNEALGKAGAKIIAHENTKLWLGAEFDVDWEKKTYEPRPKAALPNQTFYTSGKMTFGNEPIEYALMAQAHTDGDIYVRFPKSNVLMAGDVVSVGSYPVLDYSTGGWIGGLVNAQKAILDMANAETRIVPGNGPVQTRADVQALYDMCNTMRDRLTKLLKQGMGPKEMVAAAPSKDFDDKWGNPELFILNAYRGLWGHVRELGGIV
jgi:glyoxylase-like metal-dependent hydrolase (beta-lactamase superfamily II)